jgi:hypothetical protein
LFREKEKITLLQPPQIRTFIFPASGSSIHGLAAEPTAGCRGIVPYLRESLFFFLVVSKRFAFF